MKGKKRMQYLILLILGVSSVLLSVAFGKAANTQHQTEHAMGMITRVIYSDSGNVRYYVGIDLGNGSIVEAKSIHYSVTNRKYSENDPVAVKYYYTDDGSVMCELDDAELVPCKNVFEKMTGATLVVGIVLIVLFVIFTVKSFI